MKIDRAALDEIRRHAEAGYPHEICGLLVAVKGASVISETRPIRNTVVDRARDRYELDPIEYIRAQKECDERGLDVLGYYHSHPDHPAKASSTDAQRSWAGASYLIVSCVNGRCVDQNSFRAERDGGPLRREELIVA
ncbi:MAG: M67 family metallopeptidase [Candidatus Dormibacteraeota bacterium]|uniref:M67 family metallopeptidase n=1 Tax=Candidatus Dormiibacter inghamiae TaxID=3127013 RepID=A0A934KHE8_9BACT|nr:M67 family metallopeptidase [Candidatus Dormibacteraeota bacterium]MBJ7607381.1 M67 family metallopeptidase [Candidatus Dormibacteraeota bacterium]